MHCHRTVIGLAHPCHGLVMDFHGLVCGQSNSFPVLLMEHTTAKRILSLAMAALGIALSSA